MQPLNFALILTLQLTLIIYDVIINLLIDYLNPPNVVQLVLFM